MHGTRPHGSPSIFPSLLTATLPFLLVTALTPTSLAAQDAEDGGWEIEAELGGTIFFGNRNQSLVTTRTEFGFTNGAVESTVELRFAYGEATNREGITEVNRRSWLAESAMDFRPGGLWRPFLSARAESALERRIDRRYQAGTGLKYDNRIDRDNRTEFSLAILGERTYRRGAGAAGSSGDEGGLARLSSELRLRRSFLDSRIAIDLQNAYRPVFDAFGNFVVASRNALTVNLTQVVGLRVALQSEYDSGALDRGAETNLDGEFQLAVVVSF